MFAMQANWPDKGFAVPLAPILMSCSIFGDAFLLLSLGRLAIMRFFIVLGLVVVMYIVYGVHGATWHDAQLEDYVAARYFITVLLQFCADVPAWIHAILKSMLL